MKIFSHETGPLVEYKDGFLFIEDLNPHVETKWEMSRWEMFKMGMAAIKAAVLVKEAAPPPTSTSARTNAST